MQSNNYEEERKLAAALRSYTTPAVITLALYWVLWLPGLITNIVYLRAASRDERLIGRAPDGKGCLMALLLVFGVVLPILGVVAAVAIIVFEIRLLAPFTAPSATAPSAVTDVGSATIVTVDVHTYTLEQYARYAGAWQGILAKQISRTQALAPPPGTASGAKLTPEQQSAQSSLQSLQSMQASLASTLLSDFIESKLVLDEGKSRGMSISAAEMDDARRWLLSTPISPTSPGSGLRAVPDKLPTTNLITIDDARKDLAQIAANPRFLTSDQIDEQIVKPAVLKAKLTAALETGAVPSTEAQIHARHILVASEAEAQTVKKQLDGGADFAALALQYSTDTSNKDKGGDLGWFGEGQMVPEFEQAAFALKPGETSQPVHTQFGYHIIQLLEVGPNRALDPARIQQQKEQGYQAWLGKAQSDNTKVTYRPTTANMSDWVRTYVQQPN